MEIYNKTRYSKRVAIELHIHIAKIVIVTCTTLSVLSLLLGVSISSLFTSIGAAAALLTFVFKDTVLGLVSSLQLTFLNIIRVGDWVTLPQYNADGNIEDITITVVTIRNFDKTYTTVPISAFLTTGVKNWRAMFESGGRRIKRALNIDITTITICKDKDLVLIKKLSTFKNLIKEKPVLFEANNGITNVSLFRYYIEEYLKSHQQIHNEGFTFLVRQLSPTENGLPVELYVFTKDTNWINYESIQADIFDHLIGIMPIFNLKIFQNIFRQN